jgi:uncharacterized protein
MSDCCSHNASAKAPSELSPVLVDDCCAPMPATSCCDEDSTTSKKIDYLLWGSLAFCVTFYVLHLLELSGTPEWFQHLGHSVFELLNSMWWGVLLGLFFVGVLAHIPQNLVMSVLGRGGSFNGIIRATLAGVLLDLCSHGILMVGMKLYQKGASLGQVMAFLIASPWNSFSLTLILFSLIGIKWTLVFILLSVVIAVVSGFIFDRFVERKILPGNPHVFVEDPNFKFLHEVKKQLSGIQWSFLLAKILLPRD